MSYRPVCDFWLLARAKLLPYPDGSKRSYYGAYLGGFPERARVYLGVTINHPVLHVCGGMARHYPYKGGFGQNDDTLDLDPATEPDYLQNAMEAYPRGYDAYLIDPPYSEADAEHYVPGRENYPNPNQLLRNGIEAVKPGGRVGMIHYILPSPPKGVRFVAAVGVICGFNNRIRIYSVFERPYVSPSVKRITRVRRKQI